MGHASTRAALFYQHATSDRDRAIADALNELAEIARKQPPIDTTQAESGTDLARVPKITGTHGLDR
jgi:hypothetical protein